METQVGIQLLATQCLV